MHGNGRRVIDPDPVFMVVRVSSDCSGKPSGRCRALNRQHLRHRACADVGHRLVADCGPEQHRRVGAQSRVAIEHTPHRMGLVDHKKRPALVVLLPGNPLDQAVGVCGGGTQCDIAPCRRLVGHHRAGMAETPHGLCCRARNAGRTTQRHPGTAPWWHCTRPAQARWAWRGGTGHTITHARPVPPVGCGGHVRPAGRWHQAGARREGGVLAFEEFLASWSERPAHP